MKLLQQNRKGVMRQLHAKSTRVLFLILMTLTNWSIYAQRPVEMADQFRADGKIRVVIAVIAIIFIGLLVYLIRLDRRLSQLEKAQKHS